MLGEGGEEDGVLAGKKEPLKIGEQRLRVVRHGYAGAFQRLFRVVGEAVRREAPHGGSLGPQARAVGHACREGSIGPHVAGNNRPDQR